MLIYIVTLTQMICSGSGMQDAYQTPNDSIYIFNSREYNSRNKGNLRSFGYFNMHIKLKKMDKLLPATCFYAQTCLQPCGEQDRQQGVRVSDPLRMHHKSHLCCFLLRQSFPYGVNQENDLHAAATQHTAGILSASQVSCGLSQI